MAISAFVLFAIAAAYGAIVAPGKPHKPADVTPLPRKVSGERGLETEKKEAA
jgi:hypothetical protein